MVKAQFGCGPLRWGLRCTLLGWGPHRTDAGRPQIPPLRIRPPQKKRRKKQADAPVRMTISLGSRPPWD